MRDFIVSPEVLDKLSELVAYLKDELKFSEEASLAYRERFLQFIRSFGVEVDYPRCRFKRWRTLGYRCAIFEKQWVLAYEITDKGVVVQDMSNAALLKG